MWSMKRVNITAHQTHKSLKAIDTKLRDTKLHNLPHGLSTSQASLDYVIQPVIQTVTQPVPKPVIQPVSQPVLPLVLCLLVARFTVPVVCTENSGPGEGLIQHFVRLVLRNNPAKNFVSSGLWLIFYCAESHDHSHPIRRSGPLKVGLKLIQCSRNALFLIPRNC